MKPLVRHLLVLAVVAGLVASAAPARAVEADEGALAPQVGGLAFTGKLGELFAADFAYGANITYGFTDWLALDIDVLYSEHQETERDRYGALSLTHLTGSLGPRFGITGDFVAAHVALAPMIVLSTYEARFPAGSGTRDDSEDTHGFGGNAIAGVDAFVGASATLGLAAKAGVVSTDLEFAHGEDVDNQVEVYTFYAGVLRFTVIF
ncbi:porin family protein [bacterium]|nr:porin family protein [bacterium]